MAESNALTLINEENGYYCSFQPTTQEQKARLFKAMNTPDYRLGDCVNKTIYVVDVYAEMVEVTNKDTGEVSRCPRVVLLDKNGKSYQAVSNGVFSAVKKLIAVYGPPTWEPLGLTIRQISKGAYRMLTFDIANAD